MPAEFWSDPAIAAAVREQRFGKLIHAYRVHPWHARRITQATMARWLRVSQSRLSRLEIGRGPCSRDELQEFAQALHLPPALHWFPSRPESTGTVAPVEEATVTAARDSLAFTSTLTSLADRGNDLWALRADLSLVATNYVHKPLKTVFGDLVDSRDTAIALLSRRLRPAQERDAYFLAGIACLMLAHAAQNAGDPRSAQHQLKAAKDLADVADHAALRAWVLGSSALLHEWTRRHTDAVALARHGHAHATSATTRSRLLAIEARAAARGGDYDTATAAIRKLSDVDTEVTDDDVTNLGGILTFPAVKRTYYLGSTYGLLAQHGNAEQHAQAAINAYQTGPPEERSYGDETLARLDIVNARIAAGSIDSAQTELEPILALPPELRIRQVDNALARTRSLASQLGHRGHAAARELAQQLGTTLEQPAALPSARALPPP
ncbi:helix-turn-helix domain-containing protein [Amycolatopsis magusensis]|uniref:helix-turn-helix domain-containing protein n=1 Tax=Amycolatopsis magusensis TaxID=882444 RepID=UPI0037A39BDA